MAGPERGCARRAPGLPTCPAAVIALALVRTATGVATPRAANAVGAAATGGDMPSFDVQRHIALGRVQAVVPSPCGAWAAVEVARLDADGAKFIADLWKVPLDGGPAVQLTRGPSNDRAPCFRRDGALGFLSNRNPREGKPEDGDDERSQVWILPTEGGEPQPLTDEPLGVAAFRFATAGNRMLLTTSVFPGIEHDKQREHAADRRKNGPSGILYTRTPIRFWDYWLPEAQVHLIAYREDGSERRDLTPDAVRDHWSADWDVSADGTQAVITRGVVGVDRMEDDDLVVIDIDGGGQRILGTASLTSLGSPRFSPDGRRIACIHRRRGPERVGKVDLMVLELASGASKMLTEEWDYWPNLQDWFPDGGSVLVAADERAATALFRIDTECGDVTRLTEPGTGGTHGSVWIVPGRDLAVGWRSHTTHPPEPCVFELERASPPRLLAPMSGLTGAEGAALVQCEHRHAVSDDGAEIQYLVVRPADHTAASEPLPTLLWIHGGPVGNWPEGWIWRWNPMLAAARGYCVLLPNPRASTGFGQKFVEGIWHDWGGQVYRDLQAVVADARSLPYVDSARMAAMGGSFGGYMTNWIGGQPHDFRCLITHASLFALAFFYGTTDIPGWFGYNMGGTPWDRPEVFERHSPHLNVAAWKTPTLIIHGEKDYRVPVTEGLMLFEALQHQGVPSEILIFPDENHWIMKPRNIRVWYDNVFRFLDRYLKD